MPLMSRTASATCQAMEPRALTALQHTHTGVWYTGLAPQSMCHSYSHSFVRQPETYRCYRRCVLLLLLLLFIIIIIYYYYYYYYMQILYKYPAIVSHTLTTIRQSNYQYCSCCCCYYIHPLNSCGSNSGSARYPAHLPSLSPSITPSTSRFKTQSLSQILSSIVFLVPSGLPGWILTCTELSGRWRLL